ncbi:MAG TPA: DNA polymerase, partial [Puia sp.]|nr:DNA polymerase [Puia sp.]
MHKTTFPVGQPECYIYNRQVNWSSVADMDQFAFNYQRQRTNKETHMNKSLQGIIKCLILPPRDTSKCDLPPVIPGRFGDGRLQFTRCRTCATENKEGCYEPDYFCSHHDWKDRAFVTTLPKEEIELALANGYKVLHVYRAYEFSKWSDTLFKGYINEFMKLKLEAEGWPKNCVSAYYGEETLPSLETIEDQDVRSEVEWRQKNRDTFLKEYKDKFGIIAEPQKVKKNPGMKYLSKM